MENVKQMIISIKNVNDVYDFIKKASKVEGDVLLKRGNFAVDGKSFLGMLSIDISQDVIVMYPSDAVEFEQYIIQFKVK